ncbi:hypothetical protein ACRAKI_27710 [Saccharothrix isguenensis]
MRRPDGRVGPVVVSVCGVAGPRAGRPVGRPGVEREVPGVPGVSQAARATDLLGAGFADRYPDSAVRYVLHNPMFVDSGLGAQVGGLGGKALDVVARVVARKVDDAADQVRRFLAEPPTAPLTASRAGTRVSLGRPEFDRTTAGRRYSLMDGITSRRERC